MYRLYIIVCTRIIITCVKEVNKNSVSKFINHYVLQALTNFVDEMSFFKLISKYDHVSMKAMRSAIDNYCSQWTPKVKFV